MQRWIVITLFGVCGVGCQVSPEDPTVRFESAPAVGRWQAAIAGDGESSSEAAEDPGAAGMQLVEPEAGSEAGKLASGGAGSAAGAAAGSGGSASAPASSLASLSFDVTTAPVGYRYQPKNIGAIWIQDQNGKLVKSLEVWAGIRRRWLTRYASALAGSGVDVVASATLPNHRAHHVSWNLTDRSGAKVPPGAYTLVLELTDGDMTGRSNAVSFDTSGGARVLSPASAPSFSAMTLQLQ